MDIERLKKLVKLANNNPNEHEANLAARRVCKIIEDAKFEFGITTSKQPDSSYYKTTYYTQPPKHKSPWEDLYTVNFEEIINKMRKEQQRATEEQAKYRPRYQDPLTREVFEKRKIKCNRCLETKETRFKGLADTWICMECRAGEYKGDIID